MKGRFIGLVLAGVGVIIAIGTIVMHFVDSAADHRHTAQTTGKITHVDSQRKSKRTEYCPTISFTANGSPQTFREDCSSTHVYEGDTVNVYYNPHEPTDASTTKGDEWFTDVVGGVVAVGFIAYGAFQYYRGGSSGGLLDGLGRFGRFRRLGRPRQTWSPAPGSTPAPGSAPAPGVAGQPSAEPPSASAGPAPVTPSGPQPPSPAAPPTAAAPTSGPPPMPPSGQQPSSGPPPLPPAGQQPPPGPPPLPPTDR